MADNFNPDPDLYFLNWILTHPLRLPPTAFIQILLIFSWCFVDELGARVEQTDRQTDGRTDGRARLVLRPRRTTAW